MTEEQEREIVEAALAKTALKAGAVDHHWVDAYEVTCGKVVTTVFMDMYHCANPVPTVAPTGFSIQN